MAQPMQDIIDRLNHFIWETDTQAMPRVMCWGVYSLRVLYVMGRDIATGELNLRAMSLVYTTLLSLVPLLAVSFSVLKGFGVHNQIEPYLLNLFQFLGDKGPEVTHHIIGFVDNVKVSVLGGVGLALLFYTVLSLMQKIEASFNFVWRIARLRSIAQRFSNYLSVILIGPVLIFSSIGVTASVMNAEFVQYLLGIEPFGTLFLAATKLIPYVLVSVAFTFIYIFIPNTRVHFLPALIGGLFAGALWQSTGWAFAAFIAASPKYTAIYSSFAILVMLLIWFYINWLVLLLGAKIAFYAQHPQYLTRKPVQLVLSNQMKERLVLMVMTLVGQHHYRNQPPWSVEALAERLHLPTDPVGRLVDALVDEGYLAEVGGETPCYLPAMDIEVIRLADLLTAVRQEGESDFVTDAQVRPLGAVDEVMHDVHEAASTVLDGKTVKDLVVRLEGAN